jgi:hypothetical protein
MEIRKRSHVLPKTVKDMKKDFIKFLFTPQISFSKNTLTDPSFSLKQALINTVEQWARIMHI